MGKSVRIQKMVGVDKVATRAIEDILNRPGFSFPKVAVLVGGPDWPTSVLCGILKLNCLKCVIGTMPVIFVAAPCVMVGSFLLKAEAETSGGFWSAIAGTMLIVATLGQSGTMMIAGYYIAEVASAKTDELSKSRPEHKPIEDMTKADAHFCSTYANVTRWNQMPCYARALLSLSTISMLMAGVILVMADSKCFRPFSLTSKISAKYEDGGLYGNPLAIILDLGYVAIGLFFVGCILFYVWLKWAKVATNRRLIASSPEPESQGEKGPDSPRSPKEDPDLLT
jgi:hypothetical protein